MSIKCFTGNGFGTFFLAELLITSIILFRSDLPENSPAGTSAGAPAGAPASGTGSGYATGGSLRLMVCNPYFFTIWLLFRQKINYNFFSYS